MKFAKYLQKTETSGWKKAYIDYGGLKRLIRAIEFSPISHDVRPSDIRASRQFSSSVAKIHSDDPHADERSLEGLESYLPPINFSVLDLSIEPLCDIAKYSSNSAPIPSAEPKKFMQTCSSDTGSISGLCRGQSFSGESDDTRRFMDPLAELGLHDILAQLTPQELSFFTTLDAQLDKVESFYLARENEMVARNFLLLSQLEELKYHREVFFENYTKKGWTANINLKTLSSAIWPCRTPQHPEEGQVFKTVLSPIKLENQCKDSQYSNDKNILFVPALTLQGSEGPTSCQEKDDWSKAEPLHLSISSDDPSSYPRAKDKLKRAVMEHYRGLEMLHNYRVLNIAGFRKAVKKFEKRTKISVQNQYMAEKVGNCVFVSDDGIRDMAREMEEIYATVFASGDKKKACKELRARTTVESHHFSTFRSGLLAGFSISALIDGLWRALQPETQQAIPCWDILLFLYGLIFVPVLYFFLFGLNLLIWDRARVNYVFIFDLDCSNRLDYQQYFEVPSLLLATLCFAFWASFSRLGDPTLQVTTWLLIWLTFTILIVVHPIPVMAKSPRYWFIKTFLKLFLSGMRPVEFVDFWMGDQLCSFVFTISNVPLFVCVYLDNFSDDWQKCKNSSRTWPIAFGLAIIPFIIRLVQSVKRYVDSKLVTHLMNAGKYGAGIVSYLLYFMWSYQQHSRGSTFVLWCVANTCYSIYACSWDFFMDFSFLQPHSKHILLRTELMYNHQWVYYFGMLWNILVRFIWVIYIPEAGPSMMVRTFITGMFEMLRRFQWNIYRLENEHVDNMNQYRVIRKLPLPYAFDFEEDRDYYYR